MTDCPLREEFLDQSDVRFRPRVGSDLVLRGVESSHAVELVVEKFGLLLGLREETKRAYTLDVRQLATWCSGEGKTPWGLTRRDANAYLKDLIGTRKRVAEGGSERYAATTVARKLSSYRRFFAYLKSEGLAQYSPFDGLKSPKGVKRDKQILSAEEARLLVASPDLRTPKGIRDHSILQLIMRTGLSVADVQSLNVSNVDLESGELSVSGRAGAIRVIGCQEDVRRSLIRWLRTRPLSATDTDALFVSLHRTDARGDPGRRMSTRGIRAVVDHYLTVLGLKQRGLSSHWLKRAALLA